MTDKPPYNKKHQSYEAQVALLKSRGMIIDDSEAAAKILMNTNYYRLGFYWHYFEENHETHKFQEGTKFEDVIALYNFDRKLRVLILDALEDIEISMRAQWAYHLSAEHGAHAHTKEEIHSDAWEKTITHLRELVDDTDEKFIGRIKKKYAEPLPPIWAVSEIMSFGTISRWMKNLRDRKTQKQIANNYNIRYDILTSWLQHLSGVRNYCAHYALMWNRSLVRHKPIYPKSESFSCYDSFVKDSNKIFNTITMILYLLDNIEPENNWRERFKKLLAQYPKIPLEEMGFPDDWQSRTIWKP